MCKPWNVFKVCWGVVDLDVVVRLVDIVLHYQVVGGVAADEFLASVEQLDSSNKQDVLYQVENQISYDLLFLFWIF